MKKILITLTALLASAGMAVGQNALTVADITLPQNSDAELIVSYQFDVADTYTGYSFNLELPEELEFVLAEGTDVAVTKGACHDASHSVTANFDAGLVKVAGLSLSSKPLTGTSGTMLVFTIKPKTTLAVGQTFTGTIKDILIVPVEGTKKSLANSTFTVTIGEPADLRPLLDETSVVFPEVASGVDIRVKRSLSANEWNTICLPFDMTEAQVKTSFGNDVQLADFTGYEVEENEDGEVAGITVKFQAVTAIEANHPYIIKVTAPLTEFAVEGVDVIPEEEPTNATIKRTRKAWSEMTGTYVAGFIVPENTLFLSGNKFWYSKGKTKMKGLRAYFDFYDILADVENANVKMVVNFGDENSVEEIQLANDSEDIIYDMQGRRVEKAENGIYIINNKKVLVR